MVYIFLIHADDSVKTDLFPKISIYQNSAHLPVFLKKQYERRNMEHGSDIR